jgi:hypothetical protein
MCLLLPMHKHTLENEYQGHIHEAALWKYFDTAMIILLMIVLLIIVSPIIISPQANLVETFDKSIIRYFATSVRCVGLLGLRLPSWKA